MLNIIHRTSGWLIAVVLSAVFLIGPVNSSADSSGVEIFLNTKVIRDYDEMVKIRIIRVLAPYSRTFYFFDGVKPRGITVEAVQLFEKHINKQLQTKHLKVHVIIIPTRRDKLLTNLTQGLGDIVLGNLTITDERKKIVDFSDPMLTGVDEILVTHSKSPKIENIYDLSAKEIVVRKSSGYYTSLLRLNVMLKSEGKKPVKINPADENLEDEDLLEMVNAGIIPMMIIDSHKGAFWAKVFKNIKLHQKITVNTDGQIAWAIRKNSPKLKKVVNRFVKTTKKGTLTGNVLFNRYLKDTKFIRNSTHGEDAKRFKEIVKYFKKYGNQYDFDYLILAALAYQESRLIQSTQSHAGAVGVMQILPSTAKSINIKDIKALEPNVHAGTKYLRLVEDRYFNDASLSRENRQLFAIASYNAGPNRVNRMRKEAKKMGLDPDVWFRNVEIVAAKRIGRETVQYVSNIFKYYIAYTILAHKLTADENAN